MTLSTSWANLTRTTRTQISHRNFNSNTVESPRWRFRTGSTSRPIQCLRSINQSTSAKLAYPLAAVKVKTTSSRPTVSRKSMLWAIWRLRTTLASQRWVLQSTTTPRAPGSSTKWWDNVKRTGTLSWPLSRSQGRLRGKAGVRSLTARVVENLCTAPRVEHSMGRRVEHSMGHRVEQSTGTTTPSCATL